MPRASQIVGLAYSAPGKLTLTEQTVLVVWCEPHDRLPPIFGNPNEVILVSTRERRVARSMPNFHGMERYAGPAPRTEELRRAGIGEAVIHSLEAASLRDVSMAARSGARRIHFTQSSGAALSASPEFAFAIALWVALRRCAHGPGGIAVGLRRLFGPRIAAPITSARGARRALCGAARAVREERGAREIRAGDTESRAGSVVHYIGPLSAGGAQRQLVYLATHCRALGWRVTVATNVPPRGSDGYFLADLERAGVRVIWTGEGWSRRATERWLSGRGPDPTRALRDLVRAHPAVQSIAPMTALLAAERPDVLHCWLDDPNGAGGCAGLLARIPKIVVSTRSLNPTRNPAFLKAWHRPSYRVFAHTPCVRLVANSRAGADDYAAWAGIPSERFDVIPNGIPLTNLDPLDPDQRERRRTALGIPPGSFVVIGVLRLSEEKRPLDFVRAIDTVRRLGIPVLGFLIGTGPQAAATRSLMSNLGLTEHLRLMGQAIEPAHYLAVGDACLLPSEFEGCPNVPIEAGALGVPSVVTRGGGAPEVVRDGETGYVCAVGDIDAMGERLSMLATDPDRARGMGDAARRWIQHGFSVESMVVRHLDLYGALHS